MINALEAMAVVTAQPRELVVRSLAREDGQVTVAVRCVSVGVAPQRADRLLKSFYTTKQDGMGPGAFDLPLNRRRSWRMSADHEP